MHETKSSGIDPDGHTEQLDSSSWVEMVKDGQYKQFFTTEDEYIPSGQLEQAIAALLSKYFQSRLMHRFPNRSLIHTENTPHLLAPNIYLQHN